MTDPTPTPTAPDWRALCQELRDAYAESQAIQHGPWVGSDHGPSPLLARADAALATPPAATREAEPLPQAPTDEDLDDLCAEFSFLTDDDESRDSLIEMFRAVLARWGGAAVPVSDGWPEFSDCDDFERVHCFNPVLGHWKLSKINPSIHTHWLPYWALPVPAAAAEEVQP